ncbi:hypothetical protein SAMN05443252_101177 [Bacillus sp. OV322]|nr:hypothetical protein SAMN05443252_101177 [Bacillus sp. OV322]
MPVFPAPVLLLREAAFPFFKVKTGIFSKTELKKLKISKNLANFIFINFYFIVIINIENSYK